MSFYSLRCYDFTSPINALFYHRHDPRFTTQKEKNMPPIVPEIFGFLGFLLGALGALVFGFAGGRFALDAFQKTSWQVQVALVLGLFGAFVGLANYATPGTAGAFALGAGLAFFASGMGKKKDEEEPRKK
jgi:hypothetical protein